MTALRTGDGLADVVVTAVASTTALAPDAEETWQQLLEGGSGIRQLDKWFIHEYESPVRIGGVNIGRVSDITLDPKKLDSVVTLAIDDRYKDLSIDTAAGIQTAGLLGESYIALQPGGDVEVLKVGHHGSAGASSSAWLAELHPEVAVVSVGRGNRYRHPSAEALERLGASGTEVWRTDEHGSVEVRTDGRAFTVSARGRHRVLPTGPSGP